MSVRYVMGQVTAIDVNDEAFSVFRVSAYRGADDSSEPPQHRESSIRCRYKGSVSILSHVRLTGHWFSHPTYGWQFDVARLRQAMPESVEGIEHYLGSGVIPSVGPQLAAALVAHFGRSTLEVMESDPVRLTVIHGVGPERAQRISSHVRSLRESVHRANELIGLGVDEALAANLDKRYGDYALMRVRRNPYEVIGGFPIFDFRQAELVAKQLQYQNAEARTLALIVCAFRRLEGGRAGYMFPLFSVIQEAAKDDPLADTIIPQALAEGVDGVEMLHCDAEGSAITYLTLSKYKKDAQSIYGALQSRSLVMTTLAQDLSDRSAVSARTALEPLVKPVSIEVPILVATTISQDRAAAWCVELASTLRTQLPERQGLLASVTAVGSARLQVMLDEAVPTLHASLHSRESEVRKRLAGYSWVIIHNADYLSAALLRTLLCLLPEQTSLYLVGDLFYARTLRGRTVLPALWGYAQAQGACVKLDPPAASSVYPLLPIAQAITTGKNPERVTPFVPVRATTSNVLSASSDHPLVSWWTQSDQHTANVLPLVVDEAVKRFGAADVVVLCTGARGFLGYPALNDRLASIFNPEANHSSTDAGQEGIPTIAGAPVSVGDRLILVKNAQSSVWKQGDLATVTDIDTENRNLTVRTSGGQCDSIGYPALSRARPAWCIAPTRCPVKPPSVGILVLDSRAPELSLDVLYDVIRCVRDRIIIVGPEALWSTVWAVTPSLHDSAPDLLGLLSAQECSQQD